MKKKVNKILNPTPLLVNPIKAILKNSEESLTKQNWKKSLDYIMCCSKKNNKKIEKYDKHL